MNLGRFYRSIYISRQFARSEHTRHLAEHPRWNSCRLGHRLRRPPSLRCHNGTARLPSTCPVALRQSTPPPRSASHRRAPASTQPSALRQAPAPLHSTIKSTPSRRLTLPSPPSSPNPRPSTPPSSAAHAPASSLPHKPAGSCVSPPSVLSIEPQHRELHSHAPLPLRAPHPSENQATLLFSPVDFAHVFPGQPQLHFGPLPASPCFTEHRRRASSSAEDLHRGQPASSFPFVADHHCEAPFYSLMLTRAPFCFPRIQ